MLTFRYFDWRFEFLLKIKGYYHSKKGLFYHGVSKSIIFSLCQIIHTTTLLGTDMPQTELINLFNDIDFPNIFFEYQSVIKAFEKVINDQLPVNLQKELGMQVLVKF